MSEIKVPMGPQHPALKEPSSFTLTIDNEIVRDIELNIGYNHRGIEKACEKQNYVQNIFIIERICGICSMAHALNYAMGVEELMQLQVPRRANFIRVIVAELERLHSHFLWLGVAGHMIGFETLFMLSWRDREVVQDLLDSVGGNRVNYGINCVGGVRRDVSKEQVAELRKAIKVLEEQTKYYTEIAVSEPTIAVRAKGVAVLPTDVAIKTGAVGPLARASNVATDVRKEDPYLVYGEIPFKLITHDGCDIFSRVVVRVLEVVESLKILTWCLDNMPEGELAVKAPRKIPLGEAALVRCEAPRGEDIHYYRSNGSEFLERVKVRAPTMANWLGCIEMCRGQKLADIPIAIASIDPCYSCTDRMIELVDHRTGERTIKTLEDIRQYGIRWYANEF